MAAAMLLMTAGEPAAGPAGRVPATIATDLSSVVEMTVARLRPWHWPLRHACLYYALAGQQLLAEHGIAAELRVGHVVYHPATVAAHAIAPHAWLETATLLIDYAALPRWGRAAVIARTRVASERSQIVPGVTAVLVTADRVDAPLRRYVTHHRRRFQHRMGAWIGHEMRISARRARQRAAHRVAIEAPRSIGVAGAVMPPSPRLGSLPIHDPVIKNR